MRQRFFLLTIVISAILQVTILDNFRIFNVKPDLFLINVVMISLYSSLEWAFVLATFVGILKDALGINTFGINTLLFPLWSFLIMKLSKKVSIDNNLMRCVSIFIIVIFNAITTRLLLLFLGDSIVGWGIFIRVAFIESLYTAFVPLAVFKIIKPSILKERLV